MKVASSFLKLNMGKAILGFGRTFALIGKCGRVGTACIMVGHMNCFLNGILLSNPGIALLWSIHASNEFKNNTYPTNKMLKNKDVFVYGF